MIDNRTRKLLELFYKRDTISYAEIKSPELIKYLLNNKFIYHTNNIGSYRNPTPEEQSTYRITVEGRIYIEDYRKDKMRFRVPIIISSCLSLFAIVISIISLVQSMK